MSEPQAVRRIYFENLDGIRTIAFLMVFVSHAKLNLYYHFPSEAMEAWAVRLMRLGPLGVNLYFVLKLIVALALSFLLAWVRYRFLEAPFLRLKRRFAFFVRS